MRVLIAGGGTAGHVNPAVALALALHGDHVLFVGTTAGAEARAVPAAGFDLETIDVRGFDRSRPASLLTVGPRAARALLSARRIIARFEPDVVVGMGGYVALPVCYAARVGRVPVAIHEQNVVFGLTNRLCRRFARAVAVSFEQTLRSAGPRGVNTGNPVLPQIAQMDADAKRASAIERYELDPERKTLLVFGGSQGARSINQVVPGLVSAWAPRDDLQILHISGRANRNVIDRVDAPSDGGLIYRGRDFVEDMAEAYAFADLALCRGGATTVAEIGAVGLPAIIVPYPYHRDEQQARHGEILEEAGAAIVVPDAETSAERIASEGATILSDDARLERMKRSARSFGRPEAADHLARVVRGVAS